MPETREGGFGNEGNERVERAIGARSHSSVEAQHPQKEEAIFKEMLRRFPPEENLFVERFLRDDAVLAAVAPAVARLTRAFWLGHGPVPITAADLERDRPHLAGVLRSLETKLGGAEAACEFLADPRLDPFILTGRDHEEVAALFVLPREAPPRPRPSSDDFTVRYEDREELKARAEENEHLHQEVAALQAQLAAKEAGAMNRAPTPATLPVPSVMPRPVEPAPTPP
ncbi:MAG: hypothetical protein ABH807_02460 [Candidatus Shapirobacteria bacterium]